MSVKIFYCFIPFQHLVGMEELRVSPCGRIAGNFCDHSVDKCKQAAAQLELCSGERTREQRHRGKMEERKIMES